MKRYYFSTLVVFALALCLRWENHHIIFPLALAALLALDVHVYALFRKWKLWLLFALVMVLPALTVGERSGIWLGIPYNRSMLQLNILMVERYILIMLSVRLLTSHISTATLSRFLRRLRLYQFESVFQTALRLLPGMRAQMNTTMPLSCWRPLIRQPHLFFHYLSHLIAQIIYWANHTPNTETQKETTS